MSAIDQYHTDTYYIEIEKFCKPNPATESRTPFLWSTSFVGKLCDCDVRTCALP